MRERTLKKDHTNASFVRRNLPTAASKLHMKESIQMKNPINVSTVARNLPRGDTKHHMREYILKRGPSIVNALTENISFAFSRYLLLWLWHEAIHKISYYQIANNSLANTIFYLVKMCDIFCLDVFVNNFLRYIYLPKEINI